MTAFHGRGVRLALLACVVGWAGCSTGGNASAEVGGGGASTTAGVSAGTAARGNVGASAGSGAGTTAAGGAAASAGLGNATSAGGGVGGTGAGGGAGTNAGGGAGTSAGGGGGAPTDDGDSGTGGKADAPATEPGPVSVYYLDITRARVMSLDPDGGEPEVVTDGVGQSPDGIAVDAANGHIYWTNMGVASRDDGFILRTDLDGSNVTTIVEAGGTFTPKQLKLEPSAGKLYWGDREGMRVMRCNLDGSEIETLVTIAEGDQARADRANHAVGISVDTDGGYVYWIQKGPPNGGEGSIRRAALQIPQGQTHQDRTDIEVLYANLPEPIDLDVDVEAGMMYWTDRGDGTINRAPTEIPPGETASTRQDREILVDGVDVAIGIAVDRPTGQLYYTGNDVVGRANLDGSDNTTLVSNAGVLTGITAVRLP